MDQQIVLDALSLHSFPNTGGLAVSCQTLSAADHIGLDVDLLARSFCIAAQGNAQVILLKDNY